MDKPNLHLSRSQARNALSVPRYPVALAIEPEGEPREEEAAEDLSRRRRAAQRRMSSGGAESAYNPSYHTAREQEAGPAFEKHGNEIAGHAEEHDAVRVRMSGRGFIAVALALTAATAAAAAVIMSNSGQLIDGEIALEASGPPTPEKQLIQEVRSQTAQVPAARAVVEAFFKAQTPEEKSAFVRGGSAMLPALQNYYRLREDEPAGFKLNPHLDFGSCEGREFVFLRGTAAPGHDVETLVELTPQGPRLDWRFLTGMGELEWAEWVTARPARQTVMRVEGVLDDYYAGDFQNPREWLCVRIRDAGHTSAVWAYTPRISDTGLTLFRQLNGRRGPVRFTGTFTFPAKPPGPGADRAPQVNLCRVHTQGWLDRSPDAAGPAELLTALTP
jgi:hypothetical protein